MEEAPAWTKRWVRKRLGPPPWLPPKGVVLPESTSLGVVVRGVRLARKMSRAELARRSAVNREEIRAIEERGRLPNADITERLGRGLGYSGEWLRRMARRHANGLLHS